MRNKILLSVLLLFSFFSTTFWYSQTDIKIYYDKFYNKVEEKTTSTETKITVLKSLEKKLDLYISKTKNENNLFILNTLKKINTTKIKYLTWLQTLVNNTNTIQNATIVSQEDQFEIDEDKNYSYKDLENKFVNFIDLSNPYLEIDWKYYSFVYNRYLIFKDIDTISWKTLDYNWIDTKKTLYVKDWEKYYFVNEFSKIKIISDEIIKNITNKDEFIVYLADDLRYYNEDYDETIKSIKSLTESLVINQTTDEDKISSVYKWIVDNISYNSDFKTSNNEVYSWVYTFRNKTWVCDWYTKLFLYMLSFAWIKDVEVIRWFAYDNADFPEFWHAWVRIGNYYYDPTFDDPVWVSFDEYLYYKLPKELLYVNRFEWFTISWNLENLSLDDRKMIVLKNMYSLYEKYKDYNLMKTIKNRIYLWLSYNEDLTLEKLKDLIGFYEVNNFTLYDENWYSKKISSLKYYQTDEKTLNILLTNKDIDFSNMVLLKWTDSNGTDFRLAYDLEFR